MKDLNVQTETGKPSSDSKSTRKLPGRFHSAWIIAGTDLESMSRSWLCRGFLIVTLFLSVLALKGMQAEQKVASQMLEALFVSYLLLWMHGVIFIAGGAFAREQGCLNDAILSRGITRGEFFIGKLLARSVGVCLLILCVTLPAGLWAIRQDTLVRSESGAVVADAGNAIVEPWEPKKLFAAVNGHIIEKTVEVGDRVKAGDVLIQFDDRELFDELENERRAEENARNEVRNNVLRHQDAQEALAQAMDSLERAERALVAKDLLSKLEQANRESDVRARKRDLKAAENQVQIADEAIKAAERLVESAQTRVRSARKRMGQSTVTTPLSGYVTEVLIQQAQHVGIGTHLATIAPLDAYRLDVPVYQLDQFQRLREGLRALITIQGEEYQGVVDRLGVTTKKDRWGRESNYAVVRFSGDETMGILGLNADVRLTLPPPEKKPSKVDVIYKALTDEDAEILESQTASVTYFWMSVGLLKVIGCACLLVVFTLLILAMTQSTLISVLSVIGLWHMSNLIFDFAGLPGLSYLKMIQTMDKVLGGIAKPWEEAAQLGWLFGIGIGFGLVGYRTFTIREPRK